MKPASRAMWVAVALAGLVPSILCAQTDLRRGEDLRTDYRLAVYSKSSTGNQDWAREFDGRGFEVWGLEQFNAYGYTRGNQYWFDARDLIGSDESVSFDMAFRNELGVSLSTDSLTHRLARIPPINLYLAPFGMSGIGPTGAPFGDAFTELAPGQELAIHRRVNDFGLRLTPTKSRDIAFVGNWWQETERGAQQVLFFSRPPAVGRARFGSALLVGRQTDEGAVGIDAFAGRSAVLNYRYVDSRFTDDQGVPPAGTTVVPPLNFIKIPDVHEVSNQIRGRAKVGKRLYLTGVHINRNRFNRTATTPAGLVPAGAFLGSKVGVNSTNIGATYLATDSLSLMARYRGYELDSAVPPVFAPGSTTPENIDFSRDVNAWEFEGTYTGLRRTLLRGGFEHRSTGRGVSPLHPPHEEFEHPATSVRTNSNIWRAGFRYNPMLRWSVNGSFEGWDNNSPAFTGTPSNRMKIDVNTTYLVRDNLAVYGNFNRWDESNDENIIPVSTIPTPAVTPGDQTIREDAAGNNYKNKFTTWAVGFWYSLSPRLTLDTQYGSVKTAANALWIIGVDPAFLPHLPPDYVPYRADSKEWSVGLNYAIVRRWQVYGRFANMNADARSTVAIIPGSPALPDGWTPVDVRENRYTAGFSYEVSNKNRVLLDYTVSDWKDKINPEWTGRFNLWRIAWASPF